MLLKFNYRKPLLVAAILITSLGMSSCSDDDSDFKPNSSSQLDQSKDENPNSNVKEPSKLSLLTSYPWVLDETFEDGVQTKSGGTGVYKYTTSGEFKFETPTQGWMNIGVYLFQGDSTTMLIELSGTPIINVDLDLLDENDLHTRFTNRGREFIYKYKKQ